eukprot:524256-Pyramimonas_sp.AAC.1
MCTNKLTNARARCPRRGAQRVPGAAAVPPGQARGRHLAAAQRLPGGRGSPRTGVGAGAGRASFAAPAAALVEQVCTTGEAAASAPLMLEVVAHQFCEEMATVGPDVTPDHPTFLSAQQ